jgi:hypothetical protein
VCNLPQTEDQGMLIGSSTLCFLTGHQCDESKPSCMRCITSQFSCPGYTSRLKFQDEGARMRQKFVTNESSAPASLGSISMSPDERLAISLCETFQSTVPRSQSLIMFGKFITSIPRLVGSHPALDLSIKTLVDGHQEWLHGNQDAVVQSRNSYGSALAEIQRNLVAGYGGKPRENLSAIILLGIYEVLMHIFSIPRL